MKKLLLGIVCIVTFSQCNNKIYSLDNLPKQYIEIGSFGGIVGISKTYYLFPSGQRFMKQSVMGASLPEDTNEIAKIEPKAFKNICKSLKEMKFTELDLNEKGNMNYFINYKTKKIDKHVQWSNLVTAPEGLVSVYRDILKNINTTPIN